jgi:hypothetical protein
MLKRNGHVVRHSPRRVNFEQALDKLSGRFRGREEFRPKMIAGFFLNNLFS